MQAAHAMADHGAIFRHCTALRGECHRALGVSLPDCLVSSTEACDRPFASAADAADGSRCLPPPAGAPESLPVRSEDEAGYTAETVAEVRTRACACSPCMSDFAHAHTTTATRRTAYGTARSTLMAV